jgi:hypothetical protein
MKIANIKSVSFQKCLRLALRLEFDKKCAEWVRKVHALSLLSLILDLNTDVLWQLWKRAENKSNLCSFLSLSLSLPCSDTICLFEFLCLELQIIFLYVLMLFADHSDRAVYGMNCRRPLKYWVVDVNPTRGIDVCVCLFCVYVVLCVGSGWSPGEAAHLLCVGARFRKQRPRPNKGL